MNQRQIRTAVVTGPTGAVGTALCRELAQNGIRVYAVCRPESRRGSAIAEHPLIHKIACDIGNLKSLPEQITEEVDAFFHLAWSHTTGDGRDDMRVQSLNIGFTLDAVQTAAALGCRIFLGAGSQAEYGRTDEILTAATPCFPENGYGMAKLCAGQMSRKMCEKLEIDHIWVRILSVYGPGSGTDSMISTVIRQLSEGERPALTLGEQLWDYLYAPDCAKALRLLAERGKSGKVYPLGNGTSFPLRQYVLQLAECMEQPTAPRFGAIPYGKNQVMCLKVDISDLHRDTGYCPETPFADGIRETIRLFLEERSAYETKKSNICHDSHL